jgi:hypothetical protein
MPGLVAAAIERLDVAGPVRAAARSRGALRADAESMNPVIRHRFHFPSARV